MENKLFKMLEFYRQDFPEKIDQVTEKELKDHYIYRLKEVNGHGGTDNCHIYHSSYGADRI